MPRDQRILLVHKGYENLGIESLSAYLKKQNIQVDLLFDYSPFSNYSGFTNNVLNSVFGISFERFLKTAIQYITEKKPLLIGFSVHSLNYRWSLEVARNLKDVIDIPIVFGGVHVTAVPESVIANDCVDAVVVGEGYEALVELLKSIENSRFTDKKIKNVYFKDKNEIIKNPVRPLITDLDQIPANDKDLFNEKLNVFYDRFLLLTSQSCPFSCTYCNNSLYLNLYKDQKIYRRRSIEHVMAELVRARSGHHIDLVQFDDEIFTRDKKWLEIFLIQYKQKINTPYSVVSHFNFLNEDIIRLLKQTGCSYVELGLQTWNETRRVNLLNRKTSNEIIINRTEMMNKYKLNYIFHHIIGWPHQTARDFDNEIKQYFMIKKPLFIQCFQLAYLPNTELTKWAVENGVLTRADREAVDNGQIIDTMDVPNNPQFAKYQFLIQVLPGLPNSFLKWILAKNRIRFVPSNVFIRQFIRLLIEFFRYPIRFILIIKYVFKFLFSKKRLFNFNR